MPFLAAYLPRLSEVYSRTYECRASFRPATRGMVEVSFAESIPSDDAVLAAAPKLAAARRFPLSGTHFHFFSHSVITWNRGSCLVPGACRSATVTRSTFVHAGYRSLVHTVKVEKLCLTRVKGFEERRTFCVRAWPPSQI